MFAHNITTASQKLHAFGMRSKLYAYFFMCISTSLIVTSSIIDGAYSLNNVLASLCVTLIPIAIYLSGALITKITSKILNCQVSSSYEFDTSLRGPCSGMSWWILSITFFLACVEVMIDFFLSHSFGYYGPFLVGFTLCWVVSLYVHFYYLKKSITLLSKAISKLDPEDFPTETRVLIEEAQRGNIETLVDKRRDLTSL